MPPWLPPLICLAAFGGDWRRYEEALYRVFCRDFIGGGLTFGGIPVRLKRHPLSAGKEATFWHLISEGAEEAERIPDMRRCERIGWPKAVIEHAGDPAVLSWENERRHGERRACLWVEEEDYLLVLALRSGYVLPWTAYLVQRDHQKAKLRRELEEFRRRQRQP